MLTRLNAVFKIATVAIIGTVVFGVPWGDGVAVRAQITGAPTGWCTDYSGRNFRCDEGGATSYGGGGGYGGGCAQTSRQSGGGQSQEDRQWASSYNKTGVKDYNNGNYAAAASNFQIAVENFHSQDPTVKNNWAHSLHKLGIEAESAANNESASLYYYRALLLKPDFSAAQSKLNRTEQALEGTSACDLCSKAIISDIGYGLYNSAEFSNYAIEATNNWKNCLKRFSVKCSKSAGEDLYVLHGQCNKLWPDQGKESYRVCLRQAHEDASRKYQRQ